MKNLDRSSEQFQTIRPLLAPFVLVGLFVMLATFARDFTSYWPMKPSVAGWRFGALGFFLGTGALPVLGLAMMVVASALAEFRGVARAAGITGILLGVMVVVGLAVFLMDSRVVMGAQESVPMVSSAVTRTTILGLLTAPAYLALGLAGWRTANALAPKAVDSKAGLVSAGAP